MGYFSGFTIVCLSLFKTSMSQTYVLYWQIPSYKSYFQTLQAILVLMFNDLSRGIFLHGELLIYICCYGFSITGHWITLYFCCNSKQYTIYQQGISHFLSTQQSLGFNNRTRYNFYCCILVTIGNFID